FLYSFYASHPGASDLGDGVTMLAPPPGEQYPILVYSENSWIRTGSAVQQPQGLLWAVRGSPPGVRAFGTGDASANLALPRLGMRDLPGPLTRFSLSSTPPGALAALCFGWSNQTIGGVPLPMPLDSIGL